MTTSKIETLAHELTVARQAMTKFTAAKHVAEESARQANETADKHGERIALLTARIDRLTRQITGEVT